MFVIKFKFNEEYRRFRVEEKLDFNTLCSKLSQIVARPDQKLTDLFYLQYEDDEGDDVFITSTVELEEAIRLAKENNNSILRLTLIPVTSKTHVSRPVSPVLETITTESQNVKNSEIPTATSTPLESKAENVAKEQPDPKLDTLARTIALACSVVSGDVVRMCVNPALLEQCNSLAINTSQQCNAMAGQVQQSTSNFSGKVVSLCTKTADDCVSTMQPLCESTVATVDHEIQNLTALMKSLATAYDMKPQCLATSRMLEEEVAQFHQKFQPTAQECKKLQATCDSLRSEITKQCTDLSISTRDECLTLSNNLVATIMAI